MARLFLYFFFEEFASHNIHILKRLSTLLSALRRRLRLINIYDFLSIFKFVVYVSKIIISIIEWNRWCLLPPHRRHCCCNFMTKINFEPHQSSSFFFKFLSSLSLFPFSAQVNLRNKNIFPPQIIIYSIHSLMAFKNIINHLPLIERELKFSWESLLICWDSLMSDSAWLCSILCCEDARFFYYLRFPLIIKISLFRVLTRK